MDHVVWLKKIRNLVVDFCIEKGMVVLVYCILICSTKMVMVMVVDIYVLIVFFLISLVGISCSFISIYWGYYNHILRKI